VSFGSVPQLCVYNNPVTLTQGSPAGGTYSGNGVSGSQFDPAVAGSGTIPLAYTFVDNNGCSNTAQSSVFVDDCLGIPQLENNPIAIYPNPSNGLITIDAGQLSIEKIEVYDMFGKLIMVENVNGSAIEKLNILHVALGAYTVSVFTNVGVEHIPIIIR